MNLHVSDYHSFQIIHFSNQSSVEQLIWQAVEKKSKRIFSPLFAADSKHVWLKQKPNVKKWWFFLFFHLFGQKRQRQGGSNSRPKLLGETPGGGIRALGDITKGLFSELCLSAHFLKTEGETKRCNRLHLIYGDEVNFASRDLSAAGCAALKGTCGWEHHFLRQWTNASVLPTEFVWVEKKKKPCSALQPFFKSSGTNRKQN